MKLHDLKPDPGSKRPRTRVGRGISAGKGKTAGRGTKGQGSRGGKGKGAKFEGGQLPLVRRLPFKRGFNNVFKIQYQEVNVGKLQEALGDQSITDITPALLAEHGFIRDAEKPIVILGDGDLTAKFNITATRFTKSAEEKIKAAGGTINVVPLKVTGARATIKKMRKEDLAKL